MPARYTHNHYVPQWYQKRFLPPDNNNENMLYHLKLQPDIIIDNKGRSHKLPPLRRRSIDHCFAEDDLYTLRFGTGMSTAVEQVFFGVIDRKGKAAVEYWDGFAHPSIDYDGFHDMIRYMSTQKLRTPKGLDWLAQRTHSDSPSTVITRMMQIRDIYCAIWSECIWQIASASASGTKFIISDHPITVYNRECGPRNKKWCRGSNDPDIRLQGTHTIFPLSLDKVLILTNLSWVRHPYQSATGWRPNPKYFRGAMFNFTQVQTMRELSETEVRQINFIIKSRAYRAVAAAKKEWLFPEEYISKSDWNKFGEGYLLMPDPRPIHYGGEIIVGFKDGSADAFDAFGRKPWENDYGKDDSVHGGKRDPLERFKGEFARLYGPVRRGRSFQVGRLDDARDSEDYHAYHLGLEKRRK